MQAKQAERNQQSQRRFRAVRRRTERIQSKDGNALRRSDLLGTFFGGGQGLADKQVENVHEEG